MKQWTDLNPDTLEVMKELGYFTPTSRVEDKLVKGYTYDENGEGCKTYLSPENLRDIAYACIEVADFLDERALDEPT